jgi:hypothetical protein
MKNSTLWGLSSVLSLLLVAVLISLWVKMNHYDVPSTQLADEQAANQFLKQHWESTTKKINTPYEPLRKFKTVIFVHSLNIPSSSQVHIT